MPQDEFIYVDVDGTLLVRGRRNRVLVDALKVKRDEGVDLVLWSRRGRKYAEEVAAKLEVSDLFVAIIGKPTQVVDDRGLSWLKSTRVVNRVSELLK